MPFYPSPLGDDGYDITDYYAVDPRFGTLGDFAEMMRTADNLGIRVLVDLVMSHTSNQHPWFQRSRSDPDSRHRHYYRWSDTKQAEPSEVAFPGEQTGTWKYDDAARQWYMHRYYDFVPDLNVTDPDVLDEMHKVLGFWLELGISGDEIGMGEDLSLPGRLAVRNPMQWSPGPGGGFSASDTPYRPVHAEGPAGYRAVNAADQRHDPGSLYSWVARAVRARRESPELGWG